MAIRTKVVELFDEFTQVLEYMDSARKVYEVLDRTCTIDYCFVLDDGELKYKVITEGNDRLKNKK